MDQQQQMLREYFTEINRRNNVLTNNGIFAAPFGSGYFAYGKTKSGCEIYVSCFDQEHANITKEKLTKFFNSGENNELQ